MAFEVTVLGSSSATATPERAHSSQLLQVQDHYLLIDCGEGTQIQLKRFGIKFSKISHIFISHLHGDHFLGLVGLLSTFHLNGRKDPVYLFGPPGLMDIIVVQFKFSDTRLCYPLIFNATSTAEGLTILADEKKFSVFSFPMKHRIHCTGFLVQEKPKQRKVIAEKVIGLKPYQLSMLKKGLDIVEEDGKTILKNSDFTTAPPVSKSFAYCSDTIFDPSLSEYVKNVDLLYHETTFLEEHKKRASETFHSTAKQAAQIASSAGVKQLLIGHFSPRYGDLSQFLHESKAVFSNVFLARDGEKYVL
ncbi:MAG: ribonuclease Z [Cytophagales bacterium]